MKATFHGATDTGTHWLFEHGGLRWLAGSSLCSFREYDHRQHANENLA